MKILSKFLFPVLGALFFAAPSFADEVALKSNEELTRELRPYLEEALVPYGIQGKHEEKLKDLAKYLNENLLSVFKEIDYLDMLAADMQKESLLEAGENGSFARIFNAEEGRTSLLSYIWRRDDVYFDLMFDLAKDQGIHNPDLKKKFLILADPVFYKRNEHHEIVKRLGRQLNEMAQGDDFFQMVIQSWFPQEFPRAKINNGVLDRLSMSDIADSSVDSQEAAKERKEQTDKINQFNERWNVLMEQLLKAEKQEDLDKCTQGVQGMAYSLLEMQSFSPPQSEKGEKELCDLFFEKVYLPLSRIDVDIYELDRLAQDKEVEKNKAIAHLKKLEENLLDVSELKKCCETLFRSLNSMETGYRNSVRGPSYLFQSAAERGAKVLTDFYDNGG